MAADTQPPADEQPRLLDVLRDNAARLTEPDLPTTEELRSIVGALVQALEHIAGEQVSNFAVDPEPEQTPEPAYIEVNPGASPTPPPPAPIVVPSPDAPSAADQPTVVGAPTAPDTVTTPAPPANPEGQA